MHPALHFFVRQSLGIVCAALLPVFFTAFMTIPFSLGGHPGDPRIAEALIDQHTS